MTRRPRRQEAITTWTAPEARQLPLLLLYFGLFGSFITQSSAVNVSIVSAFLDYSYTDPDTLETMQIPLIGHYGNGGDVLNGSGYMVHVVTNDSSNQGCTPYINTPVGDVGGPWVALVKRGGCKFQQKVDMASFHNASAIIIYNHEPELATVRDVYVIKRSSIPTVFINNVDGTELAVLLDKNIEVYIWISIGLYHMLPENNTTYTGGGVSNRHNTAVLLTFVGFLIIGLIVVVVYAVRHAKYVHARNQATMTLSMDDAQQAQDMLNDSNHVQLTQNHEVPALILQLPQHQPPHQTVRAQPQVSESAEQGLSNLLTDEQNNSLLSDPLDQNQSTALLPH